VVAADTTERDSKFARMTDEELARAHANAVKVAERDPYGEQADSMRRLADAALEEALRRPAFAIAHPAKVRGRRRSPLARRKRAQEEALAELREACQRARLAP
jgi:lysyl-tRNA synthetase class II